MTNKKFTKKELKQIQDLNVRITQLTTQMGQIYYSKIKSIIFSMDCSTYWTCCYSNYKIK